MAHLCICIQNKIEDESKIKFGSTRTKIPYNSVSRRFNRTRGLHQYIWRREILFYVHNTFFLHEIIFFLQERKVFFRENSIYICIAISSPMTWGEKKIIRSIPRNQALNFIRKEVYACFFHFSFTLSHGFAYRITYIIITGLIERKIFLHAKNWTFVTSVSIHHRVSEIFRIKRSMFDG